MPHKPISGYFSTRRTDHPDLQHLLLEFDFEHASAGWFNAMSSKGRPNPIRISGNSLKSPYCPSSSTMGEL